MSLENLGDARFSQQLIPHSVLITGGAGFIGSHLASYINEASPSTEVLVLDDFSSGSEHNLESVNAEIFRGSILDKSIVERAVERAAVVVHLAGLGGVQRSILDPITSHEVNVSGTLRLLEASLRQGVSQFVFSSSSSVYGHNPKLPRAEIDWTGPMSPYAASKIAAESYVLSYAQVYGLACMAFRFFNVYGPRQSSTNQYAAVIPRFISNVLNGRPLRIEGDGSQSRDFTFVRDVVEVLWMSILHQRFEVRPVNLAFGQKTTILELAQIVCDVFETDLVVRHVDARKGNVEHSIADNTLLSSLFPGLSPVELSAGVRQTIEWHRSATS